MRKLIYSFNVSLDGYIADQNGDIGWSRPDAQLHQAHNDMAREAGVFIYGRRMYELMSAYWPTADADPDADPVQVDFARVWRETPKVVFSSTLTEVAHNSRLVTGDLGTELTRLKALEGGDLMIGGAELAAGAIRVGLVDDYRMFVHPIVLGGGAPYFPTLEAPIPLRLMETRRFDSGVIYLRHTVDPD